MYSPMRCIADLREAIGRLFRAIGAEKAQCRACGAEIWWVHHASGRKAPYTASGLNHFIDCPGADEFRKKRSSSSG